MYASPDDMIARYDARCIGDLVSDNGTKVGEVLLRTNDKLMAALADASGEIEAALLVGKQYTPSDLDSLTGNSRSHLVRMTCEIAMAFLLRRRPGRDVEFQNQMLERAENQLEMLRKGHAVFGTSGALNGEGSLPTVSYISIQQVNSMNLLRDRVGNYYPSRRLPERAS